MVDQGIRKGAVMTSSEYFQTGTKKGRGRAQRSLDLIVAMYEIAKDSQPITGRWTSSRP
jgi:hypothetical protein